MDHHELNVFIDVGYVLTALFFLTIAATNATLERLAHKSIMRSLVFAIVVALFLVVQVYELFSDILSSDGINRAVDPLAFGYFIGQLIIPVVAGAIFAFVNIGRLIEQNAERQRLLKELRLRDLAPQDAAIVEALTNVLEKQGRSGTLQNIMLGFVFYVLGVITPYIITSIRR